MRPEFESPKKIVFLGEKNPHGSVVEMECLKLSLISKEGRAWTEADSGGRRAGGESWRGQGGENPKLQTIAEIGMCFEKSA